MIYLLVIFRFISSVVLTIHISNFNASFIYFTQYRLLRMCGSLFCERRPARINERKPLSARRHLVNPSPQAKDELSVRCEDERSGSVVFGFSCRQSKQQKRSHHQSRWQPLSSFEVIQRIYCFLSMQHLEVDIISLHHIVAGG